MAYHPDDHQLLRNNLRKTAEFRKFHEEFKVQVNQTLPSGDKVLVSGGKLFGFDRAIFELCKKNLTEVQKLRFLFTIQLLTLFPSSISERFLL